MNYNRGIHRLLLVVSSVISVYILYDFISAYWSEYTFFSRMEKGDLMFREIPERVLGRGYCLGWLLLKNILLSIAVAVGYFIGSYLILYIVLAGCRQAVRMVSWIVRWIYQGFQTDVKISRSNPMSKNIQKIKKHIRINVNKDGAQ